MTRADVHSALERVLTSYDRDSHGDLKAILVRIDGEIATAHEKVDCALILTRMLADETRRPA